MSVNDIDTTNYGFSIVQNTAYDSKVLQGLFTSGVMPRSLRIIKAQLALQGLAAGNYAIQDTRVIGSYQISTNANGYPTLEQSQVHFQGGDQIAYLSAQTVTAAGQLTTATGMTFAIGLAATSGNVAPATVLIAAGAGTAAALAAGLTPFPAAAAVSVVPAANTWLSVTTTGTGPATAAYLNLTLVVV